jgi:hypothetical protein
MAIRWKAQDNMFKLSYLLLPNNFPVGGLEARAPSATYIAGDVTV